MPVASLRSNQVASNDNMENAKALIGMIDKKVRNLEKRKGKLDSYKQLAADGKELNEDQQASIQNLSSVELNLEFAKDLQKQFNQFVAEQAKVQKKQAKKEEALRQANRRSADLSVIKKVLELQNLLNQLSDEAHEDFIKGTNGAVALGEEVVKQIDELYKGITPDDESDVPMDKQIDNASQHLSEFFAASSKEFEGTTYKNLSDAITSINSCGYFDEKEESDESDEPAEEQEGVTEEAKDTEESQEISVDPVVEEVLQPTVEDTQQTEPDVSNGETTTTTTSVEAPPSSQETQDDLTNEHGLNFLGESEVSSKSRIHADAPPFYPSSSSNVTQQQPQSTTYDPDFAPTETTSGWDEPSYETTEPYRPPEENNQRGDRDGFRGGRGGRGGFRGRGSGRGGNRGNYGGGGGNYGGGFSRGGGQNQRGGGFRGGNRGGNRGNFRGNRGQRGGRGGYQQRDN